MRPLLGTFVEVAAFGCHAQAAVEAAFAALDAAHARWSFHAPDSELTQLNRRPGELVALGGSTLRLLRVARAVSLASGGLFDATVGGALVLDGHLPDHGGPVPLRRGEAADIEVLPRAARLRRPVRLVLDGIAKGFAVDMAVQAMRRAGAVSGWVNAGGDLRVFGDAVLPVHRREADGRLTPLGGVRQAAMASSHTGRPGREFPAVVVGACGDAPEVLSVMARSAWRADALTKVAAATPRALRARAVAALGGHLLPPTVDARHGERLAA